MRPGWVAIGVGIVTLLWLGSSPIPRARSGADDARRSETRQSAVRAIPVRVDLAALLRQADSLASARTVSVQSLEVRLSRLWVDGSGLPAPGRSTSAFGVTRLHPLLGQVRAHEGLDVAAPLGTLIVAPVDGVVAGVGFEPGYGRVLTLDHGQGVLSLYGHCSTILVEPGTPVRRGDPIARVGSSGLSTGPHLHYEVRVHGIPVDPERLGLFTG